MPMLKIRMAKNITDQIGRRLLPIATRGGAGDGLVVGARGGATQGPVGESWNELRGSSRSANDTTSSAPVTGAVSYQDVVLFNPLCRLRICRRCHTGAASGVDLTFVTHLAASSSSECQIQNSTRNFISTSGPLILAFANVAAEKGCEC